MSHLGLGSVNFTQDSSIHPTLHCDQKQKTTETIYLPFYKRVLNGPSNFSLVSRFHQGIVHFSCDYNLPHASQLTGFKMEVATLILFPLSNSVIPQHLFFFFFFF